MRIPKVKNEYNLTMKDIKNLKIGDRSQIKEPLFWRNDVINAWCISETTAKTSEDIEFGTYNEYWIGIYDEDSGNKRKLEITCSAFGGMCYYVFDKFFNFKDIEDEDDLEIQEKLLCKINELINKKILI